MNTDTKAALLYLVHRIPFPPNKGDKVRSFHLLRHLSQRYRVFLGTFVDYAEDWQYVPDVDQYCESVYVEGITPPVSKLLSLRGLLSGEALTLPYYRKRGMAEWVSSIVKEQGIERVVVFSSSMAQYLEQLKDVRCVVDFVDVDSAKWTRYSEDKVGVMAWLYRREGERLADYERSVAKNADASVLVSDAEAALFRKVAPACSDKIYAIGNGVNAEVFSPQHLMQNPYSDSELAVVFTGAMDYWPNIDAVLCFAKDIWPSVLKIHGNARFYVVGMNPPEQVRALSAQQSITVTGTVPDVRPYVKYASAVVVPLRIARGVQNKILEAMAMARPVVASVTCAVGIKARLGEELLVADSPANYVEHLSLLLGKNGTQLGNEIGARARARVVADYSWDAHLARFDSLIENDRHLT